MIAYQLISDITVTSATTSVSFTGLNITKDDDYLLVSDIVGISALSYYYLTVNNTTNTNYYTQYIYIANTNMASGRANYPHLNYNEASNKLSYSTTNIKLTNNGYFVYQSYEQRTYGTSNLQAELNYSTSTFTMSSITQLTITSGTANAIGTNSRFQLYKLTAQKIADIIVSSPTTSVDITGLAIDKGSEYMLVSSFSPANSAILRTYVNGNTTASNYYSQFIRGDSTFVNGVRYNVPYMFVSSDYSLTISYIKLTNNGYFVVQNNSTNLVGTSSIQAINMYSTSTFTSESVNLITINATSTNGINTGSRFTLYKLK